MRTEKIITILLWINIVVSTILNPFYSVQFIFGIVSAIAISTFLLLRKNDLALGFLVFSLVLSTFNVVQFNPSFGIRFGFLYIIPLLLLVILLFSRLSQIISLKDKWLGDEPNETATKQENKIGFYKREFQNLSSEELIRKGNDDRLVEEAKIAIDRLLKERDMMISSFIN